MEVMNIAIRPWVDREAVSAIPNSQDHGLGADFWRGGSRVRYRLTCGGLALPSRLYIILSDTTSYLLVTSLPLMEEWSIPAVKITVKGAVGRRGELRPRHSPRFPGLWYRTRGRRSDLRAEDADRGSGGWHATGASSDNAASLITEQIRTCQIAAGGINLRAKLMASVVCKDSGKEGHSFTH
ncbi:hypothetical protein J6590_042025 [Homalodisca vitripennis]|nr:hypothetical protein J6590_042025 [Homalodisca vitripennis]